MKQKVSLFICIVWFSFFTTCFAEISSVATSNTEKERLLVIVTDYGKFDSQKYHKVNQEIDESIKKVFNHYEIDLLKEDGMKKLYDSIGDEDIDSPEKIVKKHLIGLGNKEGYKYIAFVYFVPNDPRLESADFYLSKSCLNVSMVVKVVDVTIGRYIFTKIIKSGTIRETTLLWGNADTKLWYRGVKKCMDVFEKDFASISH